MKVQTSLWHQLKSIYNSPFKDSYSHPIHTCFAMIASNTRSATDKQSPSCIRCNRWVPLNKNCTTRRRYWSSQRRYTTKVNTLKVFSRYLAREYKKLQDPISFWLKVLETLNNVETAHEMLRKSTKPLIIKTWWNRKRADSITCFAPCAASMNRIHTDSSVFFETLLLQDWYHRKDLDPLLCSLNEFCWDQWNVKNRSGKVSRGIPYLTLDIMTAIVILMKDYFTTTRGNVSIVRHWVSLAKQWHKLLYAFCNSMHTPAALWMCIGRVNKKAVGCLLLWL